MAEKEEVLEGNWAEDEQGADEDNSKEHREEEISANLEQLEQEKAQLTQQLLRLKADFENFRRRSKNELESIQLDANAGLLKDLLPILDNFERALQAAKNNQGEDSFFQGVEMVYQGLMSALANHGLKPIVAIGEPFDPAFHEAVAMEGEGEDDLIVLAQIQTGYLVHEKVLRHTKVLVGQNEEEEECQK